MKVVFSNRAYISLLAEFKERITTETGGLFLGYYMQNTWYILETCDPGPNSIFQPAYFEYDQAYVKHLLNKLARIYSARPKLIGLWHRHPGSFDVFSGTDDLTNTKYAAMHPEGAVSMLVNLDPQFRLTAYHVTYPHHYTRIPYSVGDEHFPVHLLQLLSSEDILGGLNKCSISVNSLSAVIDKISPNLQVADFPVQSEKLLEDNDTEQLSDILLEDLMYLADNLGIKIRIEKEMLYLAKIDISIPTLKLTDGETDSVSFAIIQNNAFLYYRTQFFVYQSGLLQKLLNSQKDKKDASSFDGSNVAPLHQDSKGLLNAIRSIITLNQRR